jgi:porphobilinogen synthase
MITGKYPSLRLRRTRKYNWSRRLIQENNLSSNDLIYPIFLIEGKNKKQTIKSMPGIYRYSIDQLGMIINNVIKHKIPMVALFPSTPNNKKDKLGTEALNENNLVCKAIRFIKKRFRNNIGIMADVALDPYTSHGHDGLLKKEYIVNDSTVDVLIKQALIQAQMGCDVIAPSDMMDGRVGKIRKYLDKNKYQDVQILSYAVKYASNFYGPFRDAVGSKKTLKSDKKNYQMNFANSTESLREVALDIKEGADMVMVKPGLPYLDIIQKVKENFKIPVLAYQVSGEYSLIKSGINNRLINEEAIFESLMCFKRAGASAIVSYFALDIARKIKSQLK